MDGDSRGGAALSVKAVSGKPIKFVGTGEKLESLEVFYPDRIASRILGVHCSLHCRLCTQQGQASAGVGTCPVFACEAARAAPKRRSFVQLPPQHLQNRILDWLPPPIHPSPLKEKQ